MKTALWTVAILASIAGGAGGVAFVLVDGPGKLAAVHTATEAIHQQKTGWKIVRTTRISDDQYGGYYVTFDVTIQGRPQAAKVWVRRNQSPFVTP